MPAPRGSAAYSYKVLSPAGPERLFAKHRFAADLAPISFADRPE
jgi:hypothetical protein